MTAKHILCKTFEVDLDKFGDVEDGISDALEYEYHRVTGAEKIIQAMKEYARLMCDKQKNICADTAETKDIHPPGGYLSHMIIDEQSIQNAPYPEELL